MEEAVKKNKTELPAKDFGGPLKVIGYTLLAFTLSQLVALVILGSLYGILNLSDAATKSPVAQLAYVLLAEGFGVGFVYLVLRRRKYSLADIGLARWPQWRDLKLSLLGFGAFYALLIATTVLVMFLIPSFDVDQAQDVGFDNLNTSLDKIIAFVSLVLLPPIGEEIIMRGYLYTGLRLRMRFVWAMVITSLLFGLAHLEFGNDTSLVWVAALNTFVLSLVLVYVRERSGALYASIAIHMMNNSVAFIIHFL